MHRLLQHTNNVSQITAQGSAVIKSILAFFSQKSSGVKTLEVSYQHNNTSLKIKRNVQIFNFICVAQTEHMVQT
jgi:hypothetical protein